MKCDNTSSLIMIVKYRQLSKVKIINDARKVWQNLKIEHDRKILADLKNNIAAFKISFEPRISFYLSISYDRSWAWEFVTFHDLISSWGLPMPYEYDRAWDFVKSYDSHFPLEAHKRCEKWWANENLIISKNTSPNFNIQSHQLVTLSSTIWFHRCPL